MAWTFGTLKSSMADWLAISATDTRRLPDAVRGQIINFRHREIARRGRFRSMETAATPVVLAAGDYEIDLPSDWGSPIKIQFDDSVDVVELEGITYSEYMSTYPDPTDAGNRGDPESWSVSGSHLYIGPPPSTGGTLLQTYYRIPTDIDDVNDTSDITALCGDALFFLSLGDAATYILEEQRAGMFFQRGEELLSEFIASDSRRIYEGRRPISREP